MRGNLRCGILWAGLVAALAGLTGCGVEIENVFMGDSITAGWSVPGQNLGVPGNTTAQMLARFPDEVPGHGYKTFLILGGANDVREGIPIEETFENIAAMAKAAHEAGMAVVVCELTPDYQKGFKYAGNLQALNQMIVELATSEDYFLADYYDPMVGHPEYFRDGLHPNAEGYAVMDEVLIPVLARVGER